MAPPPKLLVQLRQAIRLHQYSPRTEEAAYAGWVRRFVRFSGMRHPAELGAPEVTGFLTDLASAGRVSASTQTQALSALLFLYRHVLGCDLESLGASSGPRSRFTCRWCSRGRRWVPSWGA